jgi:hypothetical protein
VIAGDAAAFAIDSVSVLTHVIRGEPYATHVRREGTVDGALPILQGVSVLIMDQGETHRLSSARQFFFSLGHGYP